MTFTPGITTTVRHGLMFAIHGQSVCVEREHDLPIVAATPDDLYLGDLDGQSCFTRLLEDDVPLPGTELRSLRQLYGALDEEQFGVAGRALGITAWDRDHAHCGRCGTPTERSTTERVRTCPKCGFAAYPRLSPAVIMLVERDGKCLLARNARTKMPFFSTLAGFVEVGETLEEAVSREVHEEAGVVVSDIAYFGSQPWPFTNSLMIGFTAQWASGEIHADPTEIMEAAWFSPDALPVIPPRLSIARELIDAFVNSKR